MTWTATITKEPEFDPDYPTDPVDWEAQLENIEDDEVIFITFTGVSDGEGKDEIVHPWDKEDIEERLEAMLKGLNQ